MKTYQNSLSSSTSKKHVNFTNVQISHIQNYIFAAFKDQYVVFGQNTSLPCDINPSSHSDSITLILWYKRDISGWSLFEFVII